MLGFLFSGLCTGNFLSHAGSFASQGTLQSDSQESGLDLFIRACLNSGWNTDLISSVQLEFVSREWNEFFTTPTTYTPEELEQLLEWHGGDQEALDETLRNFEEDRRQRADEGSASDVSIAYRTRDFDEFFKLEPFTF